MDSSRLFWIIGALSLLVLAIMRVFFGTIGLLISAGTIVVLDVCLYFFSPFLLKKLMGARSIAPSVAPELFEKVEALAKQAQITTPDLCLTSDPQPNICSVGRSPLSSSIILTRGLVEVLSPEEMTAVLAHEIGHIAHNDTLFASISATLVSILTWILPKETSAMGSNRVGNSISSLLMLVVAPIAKSIIKFSISDTAEFKADFVGASMTREPQYLADALEKIHLAVEEKIPLLHHNFALAHLFIISPFHSQTLSKLFSTHPSVEERVSRLRSMLV